MTPLTDNGHSDDRHSDAGEPDLIRDPAERALAEARNALRQFDVGMTILDQWLNQPDGIRLRISQLLILNRVVLEGVNRFAGTFRSTPIRISGSLHVPPEPTQVPLFVEDFCDYINSNLGKSAIHLAAYALWRLNWIHPFADGNGRTARIVSYILLCARLGYRVPGAPTIPEQIAENKQPYYAALESADRAFERGQIDVSAMEQLLEDKLAAQLLHVHEAATQREVTVEDRRSVPTRDLPATKAIEAEVEYLRPEGPYRPVYVVAMPPNLLTQSADGRDRRNWIERNPALVTAIATITSALVAAGLTWLLSK